MTPQAHTILAHLKLHWTITGAEAWEQHKIYRLSDTILQLRKAGWPIDTTMHKSSNGKRFGRYRLSFDKAEWPE